MNRYEPGQSCAIMTRDEVRAFDSWAMEQAGIAGVVLMENAGRSCAELIEEKLAGIERPKACIFCGTGNNGGDGFVVARHLLSKGYEVTTVICGDRSRIRGDARINLDVLKAVGGRIAELDLSAGGEIEGRVALFCEDADVIVDAVFGTGLRGNLRNEYKRLIGSINSQNCRVLAVDIPSGLDCDTGEALGVAVRADWTVTFAAVKSGFSRPDAEQLTGEVYVASIGVEPRYKKPA